MSEDGGPGDVVIAGGGMVGLALAVALKGAAPRLGVTLVDAGRQDGGADQRASAISLGARRMLEQLGVWDAVAAQSQAIEDTEITDSRTADVARPVLLSFPGPADAGQPVAHMVENGLLTSALAARARSCGVTLRLGERVSNFRVEGGGVRVQLGAEAITGSLLVAADGVKSRLRALAGIKTIERPYEQVAIVATVAHERPHHGRAVEHFLPSGPFAILPLTGDRSSLVWTEKPQVAEDLLAADDAAFEAALQLRFGRRLGRVTLLGRPTTHPLGLTLSRELVRPRFALIGDAAHNIHPIAGQGLNLGFRDVAALAETVVEAHRLGLDIGSLAVLERYQRWRRYDMVEMGFATHLINGLFSNDNPVLRIVRDTGLGIVDRLPFVKRQFLRAAAGVAGELPRLMRGEAI